MGLMSTLFGTSKSNTQPAKRVKPTAPSAKRSSSSSQGGLNWAQLITDEPQRQLTVYDPAGNPLKLKESSQKGCGGEGTVYEFAQNPKYLIKVYKQEILGNPVRMQELRSRILDMTQMQQCIRMPFLAWPCMPVMNGKKEVIGFAMRKSEGRSLLSLRGPASVQKFFPGWDRRDLVQVSLDFVSKLRQLVNAGVLVNDFNPDNFRIDRQGRVSFIDCDSYQVPNSRGGVHITRTFFPSHTAPELLLDPKLLNRPRNIHQVEFCAALTVFNILMMQLHPYSYIDYTRKSACGTPDENLRRGRCPLGVGADCCLPRGGWYNLWSCLNFRMKTVFIETFKDGHSDPAKRAPLGKLLNGLSTLLYEMEQDPARRTLTPSVPYRKPGSFQEGMKNNPQFGKPFRKIA